MNNGFSETERGAWGGFLNAYALINRLVEDDLQEHARINHAEFEVLLRLCFTETHRLRLQDLAAQSLLTRSGVSRIVERLERAGLVARENASEDKRGIYVVITDAGKNRFQAAVAPHLEYVRSVFLGLFNEDELVQMASFWKRVLDQHTR